MLHHVSVGVADFDRAAKFYDAVLATLGYKRVADYSPHAIAFNIWAGENAALPPKGAAGLRWFEILVPDDKTLDDIRARLPAVKASFTEIAGGIETADPSGNRVKVLVG